jgi:ABC-type multidrug transport system fused ATPase/permease subunit
MAIAKHREIRIRQKDSGYWHSCPQHVLWAASNYSAGSSSFRNQLAPYCQKLGLQLSYIGWRPCRVSVLVAEVPMMWRRWSRGGESRVLRSPLEVAFGLVVAVTSILGAGAISWFLHPADRFIDDAAVIVVCLALAMFAVNLQVLPKIVLDAEGIAVRNWFRLYEIPYSKLADVEIEGRGGGLVLRAFSGESVRPSAAATSIFRQFSGNRHNIAASESLGNLPMASSRQSSDSTPIRTSFVGVVYPFIILAAAMIVSAYVRR